MYTMTAIGPEQVEFMRNSGMPIATDARITYTEIVREQRLAYVHATDFIPGVQPYDVAHVVELHSLDKGQVKMVLTIDALHDAEWTQRAVAGWESEFEKLEVALRSQVGAAH